MTYDDFMANFRERVEAPDGMQPMPHPVSGEDGKRIRQITLDEGVSVLIQGDEEINAVSVMAETSHAKAAQGVYAFALAIDALGLGDTAWRNGILGPMHLTDGAYRGGATRTQARGWQFELVPRSPARNLMTLTASKI